MTESERSDSQGISRPDGILPLQETIEKIEEMTTWAPWTQTFESAAWWLTELKLRALKLMEDER